MDIIQTAKSAYELAKKGATVELQEVIMSLREQALELREENVTLREKVAGLEQQIEMAHEFQYEKPCLLYTSDAADE